MTDQKKGPTKIFIKYTDEVGSRFPAPLKKEEF